jgi:hypothetical protein
LKKKTEVPEPSGSHGEQELQPRQKEDKKIRKETIAKSS